MAEIELNAQNRDRDESGGVREATCALADRIFTAAQHLVQRGEVPKLFNADDGREGERAHSSPR